MSAHAEAGQPSTDRPKETSGNRAGEKGGIEMTRNNGGVSGRREEDTPPDSESELERLCGKYVCEAWLGHRRSNASNPPYMRALIGEVALAVERCSLASSIHWPTNAPWLPVDYQGPEPA